MSTTTRPAHASATAAHRRMPTLALVDLVLAVALFAVAILDPFELSAAVRWAVAGVGDVALVLAVVGVVRARRADRGSEVRR